VLLRILQVPGLGVPVGSAMRAGRPRSARICCRATSPAQPDIVVKTGAAAEQLCH